MADKKALVTGASGGIGEAFARALAKEGYQVTLVARSEAKLKEVTSSLGGTHNYLVADLSVPADVQRLAANLSEKGYDLLVNNAGVGIYGQFEETSLDKQLEMMRLNMDSLVALSHAYLAKAKQGDALINVASTLGLLAYPQAAAYAATKAFVVSLSEALWHEQKGKGVYVTALCPGVTRTKFHEAAGGTEKNKPPENISQSPEQVVQEALKGLKHRSKPTIVSGFKNGMMIFASRFMSHKAMVNMMGSFSPKQ
jgi:short-subunit dehydrogenase